MKSKKLFVFAIVALAVASTALASNFRAGDTIYLPSAGKGPSGSVEFVTDAYITNMTSSSVVVSVGFGKGGGVDNTSLTSNLKDLATPLAPGERRLVADITGQLFPTESFGFLVFFACKEGGDCSDCDGNPADCSLISVEARIYSRTPGSSTSETKGQGFVGYPWYNFVSKSDAAFGLDTVSIVGLRNEGARPVSGFRSNIGVLNASQDYSTTLTITAYGGDGVLAGSADIALAPLGQRQVNIATIIPAFATNGTTGYVVISQKDATLVEGGCAECAPGFFAYGSVLDNIGDDATTLETQYNQQLNISCVYGSKRPKRGVRRAGAQ